LLIEFSCYVGRAEADTLSDLLLEQGAVSVQAEDADADSLDEQPIFGEPGQPSLPPPVFGWQKTRLIIMLEVPEKSAELSQYAAANSLLSSALSEQKSLRTSAEPTPSQNVSAFNLKPVDDQDWVRLTQQQFEPILIGERLAIAPSWHLGNPVVAGRIVVELDPGLAFGTGSHPTTHLCLRWLETYAQQSGDDKSASLANKTVIDYGCGSGILAIAALKLGIGTGGTVHGLDIDPQAVLSSRENADRNKVQMVISETSQQAPEAADLVIANILSNPLKVLAPLLCSLVKPGGYIILSGVLERQIEEVSACYSPYIALKPWRILDGWVCLEGHRA
jgi:ribosomal protein L11 methyltransferase